MSPGDALLSSIEGVATNPTVALIVALLGLVAAGGALRLAFSGWIKKGTKAFLFARSAMQELRRTNKIEELRDTLKRSGDLIKEVQAEFTLQEAALNRIRAEAEENQRLAELNKTEADAVRLVIATAQAQATRPSKRQQWGFFLAGLFFSIPLSVGVNFLYDAIAH